MVFFSYFLSLLSTVHCPHDAIIRTDHKKTKTTSAIHSILFPQHWLLFLTKFFEWNRKKRPVM